MSQRRYEYWSILVVALTFVLFLVALFVKGLPHEILLEAGVFLVSMKLILMSRKQAYLANGIAERLDRITAAMSEKQ